MTGRRRAATQKIGKIKQEDSINHLSKLIVGSDKEISDLAARDLLRVSKRHGVKGRT